ncbi:family A1 protease [Cytidiella melzeri]|nr:family A1 protease [Cytidiella melzeri]
MLACPIFLLLAIADRTFATPSHNSRHSEIAELSIHANINVNRLSNVLAADLARAAHFKGHGHGAKSRSSRHRSKRQSISISATNTAVDFTAAVKIGNPATEYTLLLDSGSSNTFVGINKTYTPTSTSHKTGRTIAVTYGSGSFSGPEYTDKVDLGNGLVIDSHSIAVVEKSTGFDGTFHGIVGLGPTDLTQGTISGSSDTIPTVIDSLFAQKTIGAKVVGMFLPPFSTKASGSIDFGGADSSKHTGKLSYAPVTQTDPAKDYWGVDQSVQYGSSTILKLTAGIVDSGSTMILLATDAFNAYKQATGAIVDDGTGMLKLPKDQYSTLQPLKFIIGGVEYTLNANAQIWPRSMNTALGGDNDSIYLVVGDLKSESGDGLDFINGYLFMERFYTVFDVTNSRIGFATTEHTASEKN